MTNMRMVEPNYATTCANCKGSDDNKFLEVTLANGFVIKPLILCKQCRKKLMELLATEFEDVETCVNYNRAGDYCEHTGNACNGCADTEDKTVESNSDPIRVGARVYVADFERMGRCPYGTITRCLSKEESKQCLMFGQLVEVLFDDGITNELTYGYEILDVETDTQDSQDSNETTTMEPLIMGIGEMSNYEPPMHGFLSSVHANNDALPKVDSKTELQTHCVYIDYVTNDVDETMHELMKELNNLDNSGRKTLMVVKKAPVHVDHATQIIPDEVYKMLPEFVKEICLDGFFVTIKANIETSLSFDELMDTLENEEPDVFYTETEPEEPEVTINNMVIDSVDTGKSVKQQLDTVKEFSKEVEAVKEFPTIQDLYDALCKIESPEAQNLAELMQICCKDVLGKQSCDEDEHVNVCSSFDKATHKCLDTDKSCDYCASFYCSQSLNELFGTGENTKQKKEIIDKMQKRGYELKKDYCAGIKRTDCGPNFLLFEGAYSCFPHFVEVNVETGKYEIIKDSLHKYVSSSIFDEKEYRSELSKVFIEFLHPTL